MYDWGESRDLKDKYAVVGPDLRLPATYFDDLALVHVEDGVVRFDLSVICGSRELRVLERLVTSVAGAQRLVVGLAEALGDLGIDLTVPLPPKDALEDYDED